MLARAAQHLHCLCGIAALTRHQYAERLVDDGPALHRLGELAGELARFLAFAGRGDGEAGVLREPNRVARIAVLECVGPPGVEVQRADRALGAVRNRYGEDAPETVLGCGIGECRPPLVTR